MQRLDEIEQQFRDIEESSPNKLQNIQKTTNSQETTKLQPQNGILNQSNISKNLLNQKSPSADRRPNVSLADGIDEDDFSDGSGADMQAIEQDEMYEAIVQSLISYTGQDNQNVQECDTTQNSESNSNSNVQAANEERRLILEVMQLSKLENDKKEGRLNLDFLKRKNKEKR